MADSQNPKINSISSDKPLFSWKAAEFVEYKKTPLWYFVVSSISIILGLTFAYYQIWTATIVAGAGLAALLAQAGIKPKKNLYELYREGLAIDKKPYRFNEFKSFWIISGPAIPNIRFEKSGRFAGHLNVPVEDEDPDQLRLFLKKFLPENTSGGRDIQDILSHWFRF